MLDARDKSDAAVRDIDARDQLDRVARFNPDVLDALRLHADSVVTVKGVNFSRLAELSGIPRHRLRRVIETWGSELSKHGNN